MWTCLMNMFGKLYTLKNAGVKMDKTSAWVKCLLNRLSWAVK